MPHRQHPFLVLIEQHSPAINKICRSFCGDNSDEQEDLRQDIILNLWQGWKNYRPNHKSITWVWRVAINTAISHRRHRQHQVDASPISDFDIPDDSDTQTCEELHSLIRRLSKEDQQLLSLYLDGWKQAEIGNLLGISETLVQTRISRIKNKLKAMAL